MKQFSLKMPALALASVALVSLIPYLGAFVIAPILALAIGIAAGRRAAATATGAPTTAAARAGALVGLGALIGAIVGLTILVLIVVGNPAVQEFIRASEPYPEARIPYQWMAPLGALAGIAAGALAGLFDLALAVVAGFLAGWVYDHNHAVAT